VETGEMLLFRGDKVHSGMTRRSNKWQVATHLHIDSTHQPRKQGSLSLDTNYYFPKEFYGFTDHQQFFEYLGSKLNEMEDLAEEAHNNERNGWLQKKVKLKYT
jgi:hypothetical protein